MTDEETLIFYEKMKLHYGDPLNSFLGNVGVVYPLNAMNNYLKESMTTLWAGIYSLLINSISRPLTMDMDE